MQECFSALAKLNWKIKKEYFPLENENVPNYSVSAIEIWGNSVNIFFQLKKGQVILSFWCFI